MNSTDDLITTLCAYTETLAGVQTEYDYGEDPRGYQLLGGSLQFFVRFYRTELPPVLMFRCRDVRFENLSQSSANVVESDRMHWTTEGWRWTDIVIDEALSESAWKELIDESYQIVFDGLSENERFEIDLMRRQVSGTEALEEMIDRFELTARRDDILALVQPSMLLKTHKVQSESAVRLGQSKIGGCPDLHATLEWPTHKDGKSLAFLAQINLVEMPEPRLAALPESGILYFFSVYGWQEEEGCVDQFIWDSPFDETWTQVIYAEDVAQLHRREPKSDINHFQVAPIEFIPDMALPTSEREPNWAKLSWSESEIERFHDLYYCYSAVCMQRIGNPDENRLCGYANYEQDFVDAVAEHDLQLLFQLAADRNAEMNWDDGGFIYFWIKPSDLASRNFRNLFVDTQCG